MHVKPLCGCGCGERVNKYKHKFRHGHNTHSLVYEPVKCKCVFCKKIVMRKQNRLRAVCKDCQKERNKKVALARKERINQ